MQGRNFDGQPFELKKSTKRAPVVKVDRSEEFGELPEGVAVIMVPIPVYLGRVPEDRPIYPQQITSRLNVDQRVGLNRVFEALARLSVQYGTPSDGLDRPPVISRRHETLKWLFQHIQETVDKHRK